MFSTSSFEGPHVKLKVEFVFPRTTNNSFSDSIHTEPQRVLDLKETAELNARCTTLDGKCLQRHRPDI